MTEDELTDLIHEIRGGRIEGDSIDWKKAFWNLGVPESRREFLKDVAALANSLSPEPVRRLIIGVAGDGSIHDAPLPVDESELQRQMAAINPPPTLKVEQLPCEGKTVTVLELFPPFDRPYVTKINSENFVWIRQGSTTVTASRYHFDAFYKAKERVPLIGVRWRDDLAPTLGRARPVEQLRLEARERLEQGKTKAALAGDDAAMKKRVEGFEASCRSYLETLDKPTEIWRIYHDHFASLQDDHYRVGYEVHIEVTNNGNSPASNIRVELLFPDWIHVFDGKGFSKEVQFLPSLKWLDPPPPPEPKKEHGYANIAGLDQLGPLNGFLDSTRRLRDMINPPSPPRLRIDLAEHLVSAKVERLSPKAITGAGLQFHLYPLGTAPEGAVDFEIRTRVICDETGTWSHSVLRGIIGGGAPSEVASP